MLLELAKSASEGDLLVWRELLITEENHQMIQQCLPNLCDNLVIQFVRQVDTMDLRTERPGYGCDLKCCRFHTCLNQLRVEPARVRKTVKLLSLHEYHNSTCTT